MTLPPAPERPIPGADRLTSRDWRICVDFGTAASKACLALQGDWSGDAGRRVKPLPLGLAGGNADPLLAPSAIFVDGDRVFFGPEALKRASQASALREPLLSFKMLLGAHDLADTLEGLVKRNVDPSGRLTYKSVLTLYMAYLGALIETCLAEDRDFTSIHGEVLWRYSRPEWPNAVAGQHDLITKKLFEKALDLAQTLRADLLSSEGLSLEHALEALQAPPSGLRRFEGGVLEAHAAAAAHAGAAKLASSFVMVFDMGAGTTDFAGFELAYTPDGFFQMREVQSARRSIPFAGDEIDTILMNAFLDKAGLKKDRAGQAELWRAMSTTIRDVKRQAFAEERCAVRYKDKAILLKRSELQSTPRFKNFSAAIEAQFEESLSAVAAAAKAAKVKSVSLILAGGGSSLPFIQAMAKDAARNWRKHARVVLEPMAPLWTSAPEFGGALAPLFAQLEIAIGGASPLIKVSDVSQAAA